MILQHLLDGQMRVNEIRQRLPESQMTRLFTAQKHLRGNTKEFNKAMDELKEELPREAINSEVFKVIQNFEYPPKAREHLKRALAVAQEHGYYLYLLIQGDRFLSFLISSVSEMPSPFLERLVRDASERLRNKLTSSGVLADPLTRREADILRHLASEKPIAKIASELSITKNTMKTHLRHLYRKLNASDRRDAVAKGRELLNL
jgi:ATP/maltotriose-dependent transcriptional regulator MalT